MRNVEIFDNGAIWNGDIKFFIGRKRENGKISRLSKYFTSYSDALYYLSWVQGN